MNINDFIDKWCLGQYRELATQDLLTVSDTEYKQVGLGEIFEIDGKKYLIRTPETATEDINIHGQVIYPVFT